MEQYRAYLIGPDAQVTQRIDLLCANETDARQRARHLAQDHAVELWDDYRLIATFVPSPACAVNMPMPEPSLVW
jgi:hypothetical protein